MKRQMPFNWTSCPQIRPYSMHIILIYFRVLYFRGGPIRCTFCHVSVLPESHSLWKPQRLNCDCRLFICPFQLTLWWEISDCIGYIFGRGAFYGKSPTSPKKTLPYLSDSVPPWIVLLVWAYAASVQHLPVFPIRLYHSPGQLPSNYCYSSSLFSFIMRTF